MNPCKDTIIFLGGSDPIYVVTNYIKWVTTSWTDSMWRFKYL